MTNNFSILFVDNKRKKFLFFYTFLFCGMFYLAFNKNIVYFSFLPLLVIFIIKNDLKKLSTMFVIIFIFLILLFLFGQYCLFDRISLCLEHLFNFSLRNKIFLFIEQKYDKDIASFINLIIFNQKNFSTTIFYRKTISLGIT